MVKSTKNAKNHPLRRCLSPDESQIRPQRSLSGAIKNLNEALLGESRIPPSALDVEISDLQCVLLNEQAARFHHITHQCREDLLRLVQMVDPDL